MATSTLFNAAIDSSFNLYRYSANTQHIPGVPSASDASYFIGIVMPMLFLAFLSLLLGCRGVVEVGKAG